MSGVGFLHTGITTGGEAQNALLSDLSVRVLFGDHVQIVGVKADDAKVSICLGQAALKYTFKIGNASALPSIHILGCEIANLDQECHGGYLVRFFQESGGCSDHLWIELVLSICSDSYLLHLLVRTSTITFWRGYATIR